jgi:putative transposase
MAFWRLYYHLVWATKERHPLITPAIEPLLYGYIIGKANALESIVHAIGGMEEHVHVVASVPPKLAIADFVKGVKGSSAHYLNYELKGRETEFAWQRGYGVFSLGARQMEDAIAYVMTQKTHHGQGTALAALENPTEADDGPAAWNRAKAIGGISVIRPVARVTEEA